MKIIILSIKVWGVTTKKIFIANIFIAVNKYKIEPNSLVLLNNINTAGTNSLKAIKTLYPFLN